MNKRTFNPLGNIFPLFCILIFSLVAGILLYFFFRKTSSVEIFFFSIFIMSLSFEAFRALIALVQLYNMPIYFGVVITRIVYLSRFLGIFSLFSSGLFVVRTQFQKLEVLFGVCFLISFFLASTIPIDSTSPENTLLYKVFMQKELFISLAALEFFAILNYIIAAVRLNDSNYYFIASGITMVIAGRNLLFLMNYPCLFLISITLLITGAILFGNKTHKVYLWT